MSLSVDLSPRPVAIPQQLPVPVRSAQPRLPYPAQVSRQILWRYAVPLLVGHSLAMFAFVPWLFSWSGAALLWVGIYFYGGVGIDLCYHRLLTHRSFRCPLWLERFFVLVALCCLEDAPASWVATHRQHHNESDHEEDPHSPLVNFFWSHLGWLLVDNSAVRCTNAFDRYARDILRDPFYMKLQRSFLPIWIYLVHALLYFAAGFGVGCLFSGTLLAGVQLGLSWLVWGCILRTVCVWHISWSVNSLSHVFGYKSYETGDNSRNNWLVAFLTSGEGWHNNHHQDPASASNRHKWWEFDLIFAFIEVLEKFGLATNVVRPRAERRKA
jgi:stearoyl-CoA desaturase (delta-9 desaturase)